MMSYSYGELHIYMRWIVSLSFGQVTVTGPARHGGIRKLYVSAFEALHLAIEWVNDQQTH